MTNMYPSAATPRAGTFIEQQVEGLRRLGHEVGVVVVDRAASGPLRYVAAGRQVQRAASSSTWDVAHVMYGGVLAFLASRALRDLPIIISFCGTDLLGTEPGSFQMGFRGALGVYCSRKASLDANAVIVKSKTMLSRLPAAVDSGRVSVIPNGVDLSRFKPKNRIDARQRLGWAKEEFTVLFSTHGPSDRNKRLPLAEAAVEAVRSEGIQAGIKILTGVPHHLVPLWINASDVTLMTSCHEGSPNIVKETLACNRPVVSVDVGDVAERIDGIEGCHLVPPDPRLLADALVDVARGPRLVSSREGMKSLTLEAVAERLVSVYVEAQRDASSRTGQD